MRRTAEEERLRRDAAVAEAVAAERRSHAEEVQRAAREARRGASDDQAEAVRRAVTEALDAERARREATVGRWSSAWPHKCFFWTAATWRPAPWASKKGRSSSHPRSRGPGWR